MAAHYLVAATDAISGQLTRRQRPTSGDLDAAAWLACNALRDLAEDEQFRQALTVLAERRVRYREDYDVITGTATERVEHFEEFLTMERRLMLEAGMAEELVTDLLRDTLTNIERVREWQRESSSEAIVAAVVASVGELRDRTCMLPTTREQRARTLMRLHMARHGVGGAAIIVINVGAIGVLSPAGTAVSGAVGATLLGRAAQEIGIVS